jgi:hypothetical protein
MFRMWFPSTIWEPLTLNLLLHGNFDYNEPRNQGNDLNYTELKFIDRNKRKQTKGF